MADEQGCGCGDADDEGEDLGCGDGFSYVAQGLVAPEELGAPPEKAGVGDGGGLDGMVACAPEGLREQDLLVAVGAGMDVVAEFGFAGVGPMSLEEHGVDFGLAEAGAHAGLRFAD